MTLAPFQLQLDSLPDEVGSLFPLVQDCIHAGQRPFGKAGNSPFVGDVTFCSH